MRFPGSITGGLGVLAGLAALLFGATSTSARAEEARLLRFPAIHGDQIVFTYAGDLFTASAKGGVARRLTSDVGYEMFPRFSPDGKWVGFTGQYDGNTEVYVMPADGGIPKRLTYTAAIERDDVSDRMGPNNIVMGWRDERTIIFRSKGREWNPFKGQLFLASVDGGIPDQLPLPRAGWCCYSPDGKRLAYNRVFREFRTWKRYRGGQADEIWVYNFEDQTTQRITEDPAQDVFPMWRGNTIYFASDRDENRRMNLFAYDTETHRTRQLTRFTEFDVKFPSMGDNAIVFENGGMIYRLDFEAEEPVQVPIEIREDLAVGRDRLIDVSKSVTGFDVAPDGSRALFGARGDIFTVPAKHGPTRNLTQSPGVHERDTVWSPDGAWIAFIGDESGEEEIYLRPQNGQGGARCLTTGADTYKYRLAWSPDSKRILWSDKKNRLQFVDIESREVTLVDQSPIWEIRDYTWAYDGQWIAYTRPEQRRFPNIHLYSVQTREKIQVTDGWFDVNGAEFSSDGKYLFFVSERSFNPTYGATEWNHVYMDMDKIYLVTLAKETKSPLAPKSDEVKLAKTDVNPPASTGNESPSNAGKKEEADSKADKEGKENDKKAAKPAPVRIDPAGLQQRITVLPLPASSYRNLTSVGNKLFYLRKGKLFMFDLEKEKETELGDFGDYRVSANQKKMLVSGGGSFGIINLPDSKIELKEKIDLGDLKVRLDRHAEWAQMFDECWRQMRDFVYDPNLHGVDWEAMRERYRPLLSSVQHRTDLTYIIGEMIAELNLGHCYVGGGDFPKAERISIGLLGAKVARHAASGFYQITEILPGQNWDSSLRSPLTEIGVNIKAGDFIVAVDGKPVDQMPDIYAALEGKADKQVVLKVNGEPKVEGAREETVVPINDEQDLYYLKWILGNIDRVSKATEGRVGYVHIRDMQARGLNDFTKFYYPQLGKEALIIDVRGNGGGNVSPQIIERLRREPVFWTIARNGAVDVDPGGTAFGPKVLLVDQFSASDGDIVAYRFKKYRLGPVIGMRTWGGVVGIRGSLPLLDGGYLNRPEFSRFDIDAREWIMEGKGVEPDIVVDNDPAREFAGIDDQLNRAIDEVKAALSKSPVHIPNVPPYPVKRR